MLEVVHGVGVVTQVEQGPDICDVRAHPDRPVGSVVPRGLATTAENIGLINIPTNLKRYFFFRHNHGNRYWVTSRSIGTLSIKSFKVLLQSP